MSFLTVLEFQRAEEAVAWERSLGRRLTLYDTVVRDAAILLWDSPEAAPRTRHLTNLALHSPTGTTLWSLVLGLTVNLRLLGEDAPMSLLETIGVSAELLSGIRDSMVPGAAVVLLLTDGPVDASLTEPPAVVVHRAGLTARQEATLQQVFCP